MFNRKSAKCNNIYEHCTLLNIDLNRGLFINHGLHLNGLGKDVTPKHLISHINAWLLEEATIPVGLGWKIEPFNMVLDERSPTAATRSSKSNKIKFDSSFTESFIHSFIHITFIFHISIQVERT
jgi:hypothetical protein